MAPGQASALAQAARARRQINLRWLVTLRWMAVAGQIVTILTVYLLFRISLPLLFLLLIVGAVAATNVLLHWVWKRKREAHDARSRDPGAERLVFAVLALDILALTALLYGTGGPQNPFSVFYLVHLSLAAVVLRPRWTWVIFGLSVAGYLLLFRWSLPLVLTPRSGAVDPELMANVLERAGSFVALAAAALFVGYFITRVTSALAVVERALSDARVRAQQDAKMRSLATLAAGAAHELATPLSTIAVVARELERSLASSPREADRELSEDAKLIRDEVTRCRAVLDDMALGAGAGVGEAVVEVRLRAVLEEGIALSECGDRVDMLLAPEASGEDALLRVPKVAVARALAALIRNGIDASPPEGRVEVRAECAPGAWLVEVRDGGEGMSEAVLARAQEPFFSTKPTGSGMGLGLFLVGSILRELGGRMEIASRSGAGTRVKVWIPIMPRPSEGAGAAAGVPASGIEMEEERQ